MSTENVAPIPHFVKSRKANPALAKSKAARKVFSAYERVVQAAQELIAAGPPRGLGGTVMVRDNYPHFYGADKFKCSECGFRGEAESWKFCPGCSEEIMRFDRPKGP